MSKQNPASFKMCYLPVDNASMTRSRRMLKCKLCKFTSADSKEFTGHQNTAHLNYKVKSSEATQRETVGRVNSSGALEEKSCRCPYCPYSSHRKSAVVRHVNVCPFRPYHVTETPQGSVEQSPQQAASPILGTSQDPAPLPDLPPTLTSTASTATLPPQAHVASAAAAESAAAHGPQAHITSEAAAKSAAAHGPQAHVTSAAAVESAAVHGPQASTPYQRKTKGAVRVRRQFQCTHCPFVTGTAARLRKHKKQTKHTGPPPPEFPCERCPFITNDLGDFVAHRALHRGEEEDSVLGIKRVVDEARLRHPRKRYSIPSCRECSFRCLSTKELMDHEERAHGPHVCPYCSERRGTKTSFLNHLADEHLQFKPQEWQCYFYMSHWC